jgi:hypothetical protein
MPASRAMAQTDALAATGPAPWAVTARTISSWLKMKVKLKHKPKT